ncbi:MAG: hypothetical protein WAZ77_05985 [Candidatus Nitrosopolaris sp.]
MVLSRSPIGGDLLHPPVSDTLFAHNARRKCIETICRIIRPRPNVNNIVNLSGSMGYGLHHDF